MNLLSACMVAGCWFKSDDCSFSFQEEHRKSFIRKFDPDRVVFNKFN